MSIYDRATIFRELRETGFVDIEEKEVGAAKAVAFIVAKKPASSSPERPRSTAGARACPPVR